MYQRLTAWIKGLWYRLFKKTPSMNSPPMSKFPPSLFQDVQQLQSTLITEHQQVHGHFCTSTRHKASVIQDQAIREKVQADLDHAVGLFCAAHSMALFEEALPEKYWADIYSSDEIQLLKGFRHLRRCTANGFRGKRPKEDAAEFDAVMKSSAPIRGVESYDSESVRVSELVGSNALPILQNLVNKALIEIHKTI